MATKTLSQVLGGGSGGGVLLAPDLDFPKNSQFGLISTTVGGIDASGGLTTILSLTGKFQIQNLWMTLLVVDDINTVKLTVDGTVIWNVDPLVNSATESFIAMNATGEPHALESIICLTSFLFEMQMDSDTSITLNYVLRPIL